MASARPKSEAELEAWLRSVLPLYEYIGLRIDSWGEAIQCSVPLTPENRNHFGAMHAAVQWAVAETVGGVAYFAHADELGDCWVAVRAVTIEFRRPAMTDVRARARFGTTDAEKLRAELEATGRAQYVVEIELLDANDAQIATATGRYHLRVGAGGNA